MMDELVRKRGGGRGGSFKRKISQTSAGMQTEGMQASGTCGAEDRGGIAKSYPNMASFSKAGSNSAHYTESGGKKGLAETKGSIHSCARSRRKKNKVLQRYPHYSR